MNIKYKDDDRIFYEICEQLEIRGECVNNDKAFRTMVGFLKNLYDSSKQLRKDNSELKRKVALYEQNATLLFQINQPTATKDFVVDSLNAKDLAERIEEANTQKTYFKNPPVRSFEPTYEKPYQYIVTNNCNWFGFNDYVDAIRKAVNCGDCTIWTLEWDKYKGDWKLCRGEYFNDGVFHYKTDYDFLHYGTLNGFLCNGSELPLG